MTAHMDETLEIQVLDSIYSLADAWDRTDDWTGVTSTAERKKRQNRINQRAMRRRKNARRIPPSTASSSEAPLSSDCLQPHMSHLPDSDGLIRSSPAIRGPLPDGPVLLTCPIRAARAREFLNHVYEEYMLCSPQPRNLNVVIRLNALNAVMRNAVLMGLSPDGLCHDSLISPYNQEGPRPPTTTLQLRSRLEALQPTSLQRKIQHHPWIDLFPFPRFRENVLLAVQAEVLDEDELCLDILEPIDDNSDNLPHLIVWGESCDSQGWEANRAFLQKWGWLFRGCPEIIESTNKWRGRRGEKGIVFDVS